jgi:hypothetical protein
MGKLTSACKNGHWYHLPAKRSSRQHQTIDARVPGSNPSISQGWDYWQSPVTPLLGGRYKGLTHKPASANSDGICVMVCPTSS